MFRRFNDDLVLNIVLKGLDLCMIVFVNLCLSFDIYTLFLIIIEPTAQNRQKDFKAGNT